MKLSKAIREGAKLHSQGFGEWAMEYSGTVFTCALGAAHEAALGKTPAQMDTVPLIVERLNHVIDTPIDTELAWGIIDRNDTERQTREQIADWLEGMGL